MVVRLDHHAISFKRNPFFKDIRTHVTSAKRTAQPARRTTLAYGKRAHGPNTALVRSETFLMVQNWECLRTRHNIHTWLAAFGCRSCFWCQHYQLMRRCYPANCTFNACRGFPSSKLQKKYPRFYLLWQLFCCGLGSTLEKRAGRKCRVGRQRCDRRT